MSQISPPIRIVLVASLGLIAAWMLFLRPKAEPVPAPPTPAVTAPGVDGLTNAVDQANAAGAAQEARNDKVQNATGEETGAATAPATQNASGSKAAGGQAAKGSAKGLPQPVQKAIDDKKVLVLLFHNPKSADDRLVRKALPRVDRWGGEVVVRSANVKSVSRYGKVARGADVEQSPTVIVVDRNQKAERLVGYVDAPSIDQAVVDAMRNSGGIIKDRYLRAINDVCRTGGQAIFEIPTPTKPGAEVRTALASYENRTQRFASRFKAIPAPAKWRGLKRASVADLNEVVAISTGLKTKVGSGTQLAPVLAAAQTYGPRAAKVDKRWNARMDKHHVLSCGSNF